MYCVVWDNGAEACGSTEDRYSFDEAKDIVMDMLMAWMDQSASDEDWNDMIWNAWAYVGEYDPDKEEYVCVWEPSDDDLKGIGWVEREE